MPDLQDLVQDLRKLSPVVKFACFSTAGLTFLVIMKPERYYREFAYTHAGVFEQYRFWKLWTSFFVGSTNINLVYEMLMLYQSLTILEKGPFANRLSDLAWQLFFACIGIILATRPFETSLLLHPLLACLSYIAAETAPLGSTTSLMGLLTFPVSYLPYTVIFIGLLVGGPYSAGNAVAGALVGFIWFFLIWRSRDAGGIGLLAKYGRAPEWLRSAFGERWQPINGGGFQKGGRLGKGIDLSFIPAKGGCGKGASVGQMWNGI